MAFLIPRITAAIVEAWQRRVPAQVGWGKSDCPQFVHCRRWIMQPGTAENPPAAFTGQATNLAMMNPGYANTNKVRQTGPVDPAVTVLAVRTLEGKPSACWPTTRRTMPACQKPACRRIISASSAA